MRAALSLPGLAASLPAHAQVSPEQGTLEFKNVEYADYQPHERRMRLSSPMVYWYLPVKDVFAVEGAAATETLSGASPLFHNTLSGASGLRIHEHRRAADIKLTAFLRRASFGVQAATSTENDFESSATTIESRISSEDNNTTLALAVSSQSDAVGATGFPLLHEARSTRSYLVGVTRVLTPLSIVQSNLTYSAGTGYFSDPYKLLDNRPRSRDQFAWLARYNRYFPQSKSALHLDYRYYRDNWSVQAHTVDLKYYYPLGGGWTVRPRLRYYTQSAAFFYSNAFPPEFPGQPYSADQRLASFGAVSLGVKLVKALENDFSIDLKAERYEQRATWRLSGSNGSPLQPFYAYSVSVGVSKKF